MGEYKVGEIVNVTIKSVRVHETDEHGCVQVAADAHDGGPAHWWMPPQAAIERVAPADWPPQPGDLWRGKRLWFVRSDGYGNPGFISDDNSPARDVDSVNQSEGPLTLVYREAAKS